MPWADAEGQFQALATDGKLDAALAALGVAKGTAAAASQQLLLQKRSTQLAELAKQNPKLKPAEVFEKWSQQVEGQLRAHNMAASQVALGYAKLIQQLRQKEPRLDPAAVAQAVSQFRHQVGSNTLIFSIGDINPAGTKPEEKVAPAVAQTPVGGADWNPLLDSDWVHNVLTNKDKALTELSTEMAKDKGKEKDPAIEKAKEGEKEEAAAGPQAKPESGVQAKGNASKTPANSAAKIPSAGGAPLPGSIRNRMEPKLGADLSAVKVHTGGKSSEAASALGARAFTIGTDVHFNSGEFAPGTKEGDRLLAHELTHTVQGQRSGIQRKPEESEEKQDAGGDKHASGAEVSKPGEPAEEEADKVADDVTDKLHGAGDKKPKDEKGDKKAPAEKAPEIGAKLSAGATHVFSHGGAPRVMRESKPAQEEAGADKELDAGVEAGADKDAGDHEAAGEKNAGGAGDKQEGGDKKDGGEKHHADKHDADGHGADGHDEKHGADEHGAAGHDEGAKAAGGEEDKAAGGDDEKAHGDEAAAPKEAAPPIAAKLEGVGRKVFLAKKKDPAGDAPDPAQKAAEDLCKPGLDALKKLESDPLNAAAATAWKTNDPQVGAWQKLASKSATIKAYVDAHKKAMATINAGCDKALEAIIDQIGKVDKGKTSQEATAAVAGVEKFKTNEVLAKWQQHPLVGEKGDKPNKTIAKVGKAITDAQKNLKDEIKTRKADEAKAKKAAKGKDAPKGDKGKADPPKAAAPKAAPAATPPPPPAAVAAPAGGAKQDGKAPAAGGNGVPDAKGGGKADGGGKPDGGPKPKKPKKDAKADAAAAAPAAAGAKTPPGKNGAPPKDAKAKAEAPKHTEAQSKAEIAQATTPAIEQGKGEPPAKLSADGGALENMKSDSPDPIKLKDDVVSQTKAYLALPDTLGADAPERKALLEKIKVTFEKLREAMKHARGENDKLVQLRVKFEKFLGTKATGEWTQGVDCVDAMCTQAKSMILAEKNVVVASAEQVDGKLKALPEGDKEKIGEQIGTSINKGFAGVVGTTFDSIIDAMTTGSLVQKAQGLIGFTDGYLVPKVLEGAGAVFERAKANLKEAEPQLELAELLKQAAQVKTAKEKKAILLTSEEFRKKLAAVEGDNAGVDAARGPANDEAKLGGKMDTKIPEQPIENCDDKQLDFVAQQANPQVDLKDCKTKEEKIKKLKAAGIKTSKPKGALVDATSITTAIEGITKENKAFIEGKLENIVDPKNTWIVNANKAKAPLKAGISGTTARFVGASNLLGGNKNGAVVAMLGHLQAIEAHSFWEIVDGAGIGMEAGKYTPFPPHPGGMTTAAGQFIDQNGYDALGPGDKGNAQKTLLGEEAK